MQQADKTNQVASPQERDQQLAEIIEEEMTHQEQVSVLSQMHLQHVEEVKVQSQEIWHLLVLGEKQKEVIEQLSTPKSPDERLGQHKLTLGPSWMQCRGKYLI